MCAILYNVTERTEDTYIIVYIVAEKHWLHLCTPWAKGIKYKKKFKNIYKDYLDI